MYDVYLYRKYIRIRNSKIHLHIKYYLICKQITLCHIKNYRTIAQSTASSASISKNSPRRRRYDQSDQSSSRTIAESAKNART